jgi:AcrR family transcriptional regulator
MTPDTNDIISAEAEPRTRGEARTEAILDAAIELIAEVGYDRMTMGAIATRARASKATMYRRWPGKAELVAEAFTCHQCAEVVCPPDTGSLRGDLLAMIGGLVDSFAGQAGQRVTGLLIAMREDPALAAIVRTQLAEGGSQITGILLSRAAERGELPSPVDGPFVLALAPAVVITRSLLLGGTTDTSFQHQLVDQVLLPLLTGQPPSQG